jgi:hypothetical protein
MRGTDIGAGGHGRHVGGQGDKGPCRGRPSSTRRHVNDDRHRALHYCRDHGSHGKLEAPGSIQDQNETLSVASLGFRQRFLEEIRSGRADGAAHPGEIDGSPARAGGNRRQRRKQEKANGKRSSHEGLKILTRMTRGVRGLRCELCRAARFSHRA